MWWALVALSKYMRSFRIAAGPLVVAVLVSAAVGHAALALACAGDCNADGAVTGDELLVAVTIAQGTAALGACPRADADDDGSIFVDEIVAAVGHALEGCPLPPTPTPSPTPTVAASPPPIPTESAALRAWLRAGYYKPWAAESTPHPSAGPHGTLVRTFVNDVAFASLAAGHASHPAGAALVKELYFTTDTSTPSLWAVSIKTRNDSANGQNWYWWEGTLGGFGLSACVPCHRGDFGNPSRDFVLTPYPLY